MTIFTNLTPGAAKLQQHFLDNWAPPSEETIKVWKALNSPQSLIDARLTPDLTMHQEQLLATMQEWEREPTASRRYRLARKLRDNGIEPTDFGEGGSQR